MILILFSFIFSSCGKENQCDIFNNTLTGSFQSLLTPDTVVEFSGGVEGTTNTIVGGNLVSQCSYVIDDCKTGYTISTCNGIEDVGTIEITDMDLIHIEGVPFVRIN